MGEDNMTDGAPAPKKPEAIQQEEYFEGRPFTLSAVALQRICDIMSQWTAVSEFSLRYSDRTNLPAVGLERVLGDDNSERRAITEMQCRFGSDSEKIVLNFVARFLNPISLMVSTTDRERIWLPLLDLKEYVSNEVAVHSRYPKWAKILGILCSVLACCSALIRRGAVYPPVHLPTLVEAMQSADPNVKLNYLLEHQEHLENVAISWPFLLPLVGIMLLGMLAIVQVANHNTILPTGRFPRNHFVIGGGAERYAEEVQLRASLFWGVLVALVVGVLGSVIVLLAKPS